MITILSPAKTLRMDKAVNTSLCTNPIFIREANSLIKELIKYSPEDLEGLMKVNSKLAEQNFMRHITWEKEHNLSNGKQALLAYDGAVFKGLNADDLNERQLAFANEHLIILSGLYGALRPLDLIQPYRLEMGTKLKNKRGNNLYDFWGNKITTYIKKEILIQNDNTLINLASKEYYSIIDMSKINAKVITPVFKDYKNGTHKGITIYTKRARGLMSRFIIENNISLPSDLKKFNEEGYRYNEYLSSHVEFIFTR
ncbi:peroxide stress protein YaaA [Clostridium estertheticum]|uniref:peroxide stress protein YaaA n=1 Tax=Clostridium estertheticum TaxID=238834 RepID=UPI001C7D42C3|nr:peroxide stress protein YaaA [Clostridium estertheticum]MBX4262565.1 peroxide stress protein YaaA [Clostridium estertheticum]WLC71858.1 peroxide stress protein YaaA [Clostridium estertheticum]